VMGALKLAVEAGASVAENIVLIGGLMATGILSEYIDLNDVERALKNLFSGSMLEVNVKAVRYGYEYVMSIWHSLTL